jgi:hypothetical protein
MGFVMVLSWSRMIYLRFFLGPHMENFLRGHVGAFAAWNGVPRTLLPDYVPRNIIRLMWRKPLCAPTLLNPCQTSQTK